MTTPSVSASSAILLRTVLLIVPLAIVANMWRNPTGLLHYVEIVFCAACLVVRERISYAWWKGGVGR